MKVGVSSDSDDDNFDGIFDFNSETNKIVVVKKDKKEYEIQEFMKLFINGHFDDL